MAAPVAAMVIIRREKQLVAHFRRLGALDPSRARSRDELAPESGRAWARLAGAAVIRATPDGRFYLDAPSWEARERMRRRRLVLAVLLAVTVGLAAWLRTGGPR